MNLPKFLICGLSLVAGGTTLSLAALAPGVALAQADPDYDDLDTSSNDSRKKRKHDRKRVVSEQVREIVRGTYAQANIGGAMYLGQFSGWVSPGTALGLSFGQDFIDHEKHSMSWELSFYQGVHNGTDYETALSNGGPPIEGDLRTYTVDGTLKWATYPTRRVGLGLRAGGGVLFSPLLIDHDFYNTEVLPEIGGEPGYHGSPHPVVVGGPTFEYYTKLSHFSVGMNVDAFYAIGFDLGMNITGDMKYTF